MAVRISGLFSVGWLGWDYFLVSFQRAAAEHPRRRTLHTPSVLTQSHICTMPRAVYRLLRELQAWLPSFLGQFIGGQKCCVKTERRPYGLSTD